ncbi:MBOAT family protein [Ideonella sp.]|uniref:MBOAT family O-acyltransferase n=1 Tax=Ideonella sp. TaxID=1929293 RepID=UPI0035B0443D
MFFTSYEFLFLFVPIAWLGFAGLVHRRLDAAACWWLVACSLVFYASLDPRHIPQLLVSVVVNHLLAAGMVRWREHSVGKTRALLITGVAFNIGLLAWLKYAGLLFGDGAPVSIPLGISFYTVQQIGYLVSTYNDRRDGLPPLRRYLLFVAFFPYVIAGPVVTRDEMFSQFAGMSLARMKALFLPALTLFSLGLFKKVVFADNLGLYVDSVYEAAGRGVPLSTLDAWGAASLYTLQIYFDFSGYSDMAAGLAGLFGLSLPRNFHSPLKARSIMEFWRRWHMSATRFFTNHIYLPLVLKAMRAAVHWRLSGVGGAIVRYLATVLLPMLVTFFLIGLWHGAGVTAMVFGLLMGAAISVNHLWVKLDLPAMPRGVGWAMTTLIVVCGMVFSRSDDMATASLVLQAMAGQGGASTLLDASTVAGWLLALGGVALLAPNTHEIMERFPVVLKETWDAVPRWQQRFTWHHGTLGTLFASVVFCSSAVLIPKAAQFIYYRF